MPMRPILLLAVLLLAACAACAGKPAPEGGGSATADGPPPPALDLSADAPGTAPEEPAMTCRADTLSWTIGQLADDALVARARAEAGADRVRVIRPGMAVTMDYREDRLNLDVDAEGKVVAARCG